MNPYVIPGLYTSLDMIENAAIRFYGADPYQKTRQLKPLFIRYIVFRFGFFMYKKTSVELGLRYRQDHATVLNGMRKISWRYKTNQSFRNEIDSICQSVGITINEVKRIMN